MDVAYVNPFIVSTVHTFKTMLNTDAHPQPPVLKANDKHTYDVTGIIGLSGDAQGSIAISFSKVMTLKVVSKLLGTEIKIIDRDVADGIGELANIIAGNAKQHLAQFQLSISLPKVIVGQSHWILAQKSIPSIVVPFKSSLGEFSMEVALKSN
jgi:chemotaxis protein CheX